MVPAAEEQVLADAGALAMTLPTEDERTGVPSPEHVVPIVDGPHRLTEHRDGRRPIEPTAIAQIRGTISLSTAA